MIDSIDYFLRVKKEDLYLICPYFEAFEGMAAVRTPRPETGEFATIKLMVSPDFVEDFEKVVKILTPFIPLSIIDGEGETLGNATQGGEE